MKAVITPSCGLCIYKLLFLLFCLFAPDLHAQSVSINNTGAAANASSMLDVSSTTKGMLIPRMLLADRTAMNPLPAIAQGLMVYQTDGVQGFYYNTSLTTTPNWIYVFGSNSAWSLTGNSGTDTAINFIGTRDAHGLLFKVNNQKAGYIDYNPTAANTGFGYQSLNSNTGQYNSAFGYQALYSNTTGNNNIAVGLWSLYSNVSGNNGVAIGYNSQYYVNNTTSSWNNTNTSIGYNSLRGSATPANNTGIYNNAIGRDVLLNNSTGSDNTADGYQVLYSNTKGSDNTANGYHALYSNTSASQNIAIGTNALYTQSYDPGSTWISGNVAVGFQALYSNQPTSGVSGAYNTATGTSALYANTVGRYNTAYGISSLNTNTIGEENTAIGESALSSNTDGFYNTGIGGYSNTTGSLAFATAIGYGATVNATNKVRIGSSGVTVIEGQVAYSWPSDGRFKENVKDDVKGLDFIMKLLPVSYNFNRLKYAQHIKEHLTAGREKTLVEQSQNRSVGFIAQDVEKIIQQTGFTSFDAVHAPTSETDNYSMGYAEFVVPLVKAVQEQQQMIVQQKEEITQQKEKIDALTERLNKLEKLIATPTSANK